MWIRYQNPTLLSLSTEKVSISWKSQATAVLVQAFLLIYDEILFFLSNNVTPLTKSTVKMAISFPLILVLHTAKRLFPY